MIGSKLLVGQLTAIYTSAEVDAGETAPIGTRYSDSATNREYIFLENAGATAIAAGESAKINDASAFKVELSDTKSDEEYAGSRVVGATSMAQTEHGWFQYRGNLVASVDGTATALVAGEGVQSSGTNGHLEGITITVAAEVLAKCGVAQAASAANAEVEVMLTTSIWG